MLFFKNRYFICIIYCIASNNCFICIICYRNSYQAISRSWYGNGYCIRVLIIWHKCYTNITYIIIITAFLVPYSIYRLTILYRNRSCTSCCIRICIPTYKFILTIYRNFWCYNYFIFPDSKKFYYLNLCIIRSCFQCKVIILICLVRFCCFSYRTFLTCS